ncbi:hypothetical protein [Hafnia alvei]|uniref:hypothetical protein n=1 Tax=Hafnia alvei TaxID=569 RepID=UPI0024A94EFA|nr:hypothetical protein [Hafnia alvei]
MNTNSVLMQLFSTSNAPIYPSSLTDVLNAVENPPVHFSHKLAEIHGMYKRNL